MNEKCLESRIVWIDWMKVWATLAVIWGHFFAKGDVYVFVFSLQVFCVISGFLYKKCNNWIVCISKCFWQLFVPTLIMSLIMQLEAFFRCMVLEQDYEISWPWFFEWLLLGHRWCMGPCWYFYSLIVMRIIMQVLPVKKWAYALLFVALSAGAVYLNSIDVEVSNANVNVLVCMPFFLIGYFLKPLKSVLNNMHNYYLEAALLVVSVSLVIVCGHYNGYVWMYLCGYGNNYILYIIGGMDGAVMLYVVSLWLSRLSYRRMVLTLSKGSILIIGLHIVLVRRLVELPNRMWGEDIIMAILILLLFVPVVRLTELFFPLLLGRHQ